VDFKGLQQSQVLKPSRDDCLERLSLSPIAWADVPPGFWEVASFRNKFNGSAPFPQLLPNLNENLDLPGSWKAVVNQAAIIVKLASKSPERQSR
jgi:hypothetical protein